MARMARVVVPQYPHHVTQRGNRGQKTFFSNEDYQAYFGMLAGAKAKSGVEIWAYCFMPNHVHLVVVPEDKDSLAAFFSEAHRRYTRMINRREGWRGHLWQERFHSFIMDETHLLSAVRYTELNPTRARLCAQPNDWNWSSVHAHLRGEDDALVTVKPMLERISNWQNYLDLALPKAELDSIRAHTKTGRPIGDDSFMQNLERVTGHSLRKCKTGPKK
ncbi:MAG: putative transposase [Halieaceae bacterium]|jgi:putative transposase